MARAAQANWRQRHRAALRLMSCLAVVPIGLGPSVVAFADVAAPADTTTTTTSPPVETTTTTVAPTTTAPPVDSTTTTSAPDSTTVASTTTVPPIATTTVPATSEPVATTVDPGATTSTDAPSATTSTIVPGPTTTVTTIDPVSGATSPPTTDASSTSDVPSPTSTVSSVPATTSAATTDVAASSSTVPPSTKPPALPGIVPDPPAAAGDPTDWTVGLEPMNRYGYPLTWSLSVSRTVSTRDAFDLAPGEQSTPVSRDDGRSYVVQATGNNINNLDKLWSCVGDDTTTPQTSTAAFLFPAVSVDDLTMDCTLTMSNPTPSQLIITHRYDDAPAATATYDVSYNTTLGGTPGVGGTLATGDSTTLSSWQNIPLLISTTGIAGAVWTDLNCTNSTGDLFVPWNRFRAEAEIYNFQMRAGEATTCEFVYSSLGTITVLDDIVPDSAAGTVGVSYSVTPAAEIAVGPSDFSLLDGQSETLSINDNERVFLTRQPLPEFVLDDFGCVKLLAGGGSEIYNPTGSWSSSGNASLSFRPRAGEDFVCTFTSSPAGPPEVRVEQSIVVIDPTAFDDLQVEVRDLTSNLVIATLDASTGGTFVLPERGSYSLTVLNPQGLDVSWSCGSGTGASTTIDAVRGQSFGCTATLDENPPAGTGTLTIEKVTSPDPARSYGVDVLLGAYPIDADRISEGSAMLVTDLAAGTYTIFEETPINQNLTSVDCGLAATSTITRTPASEDGQSIWSNRFTVEVADGDDVTCELTNELVTPPSVVEVYIDIDPSDGTEAYSISVSPTSAVVAGPTTQSLVGGNFASFFLANDTEVTITQTALTGFVTLSSCGFVSTTSLSQTFTTPALGGTTFCNFENGAVDPQIEVFTSTVPAGPTPVFDYTAAPGASVATFSQAHGESTVVEFELGAGDPTITQTPVAGYVTLSGCGDPLFGDGITLTESDSATVMASSGDELVCVFENRLASASLTVGVDHTPDAPSVQTDVEGSGNGGLPDPLFDNLIITGDGTSTATPLADGLYTIDLLYPFGLAATSVDGAGCVLGSSSLEEVDGFIEFVRTEIRATITGGIDVNCTANLEPFVHPTAINVTTFGPIGETADFDYEVTPTADVISGAEFSNNIDESTLVSVTSGTPITISQTGPTGFDVTVECTDSFGVNTWTGTNSVTVNPLPLDIIECTFTNTAIPSGVYSVTLNASVSTGPVDVADRFTFLTSLAGPGLRGPAATGTPQSASFSNGDSTSVLIDEGTAITIDASDALAGADGFEYSIDCGVYFDVNSAVTFTPSGNVECALIFEARTVTVNKYVDPFVIGGFDEFELEVSPALDPMGTFLLRDGEQEIVVVALSGTPELTELDFGPYDPSIQCSRVEYTTGVVSPPTGPFGGDSVQLLDNRSSYECDVINSVGFLPAYEITLRSELDLGSVEVPSSFAGVDVEFDGDLADDFGGEVPQFGPASQTGTASVGPAPFGVPAASLLDTVTVAPNGTVSVFVVDGGDVTIRPSSGSESFTTTVTCPGGIDNPDGSVTLQNVGAAASCLMLNSAGNVTLTHSVTGPTTETSWPFSIGNVIAGPSIASLGDGDSITVAVGVDSPTALTQTDARGASSVSSGCGAIGVTPFTGYRSLLASMIDNSEVVTVSGGQSVTCSFVTGYSTVTTPTTTVPTTTVPTPTTTVPTPTVPTPTTTVPATTIPGASTTAPPASVPTTTLPPPSDTPTVTTPGATTTTTVSPTPQVPFANPGTTPTAPTIEPSPSTVPTQETTVPDPDQPSEPPTTGPPADDTTPSTVPEDPPPPIITDDPDTPDVFVDIGDPIPVDIDCDGETIILVNGIEQDRVDQIEPSALGLGDHVIEVRCDDETITEVRAVVFEQAEGAPAGSNMTVIVMFVVMAVGAFVFAPSAAGRKRLAV